MVVGRLFDCVFWLLVMLDAVSCAVCLCCCVFRLLLGLQCGCCCLFGCVGVCVCSWFGFVCLYCGLSMFAIWLCSLVVCVCCLSCFAMCVIVLCGVCFVAGA